MSALRNKLLMLLGLVASIATGWAVDKDGKVKFTPPTIESLQTKQTISGLTIAAVPFIYESQAKPAFGKLVPYEHGVLPVLVLMRNDSKAVIKLDGMRMEYLGPDRARLEATPASEVKYARSPSRPRVGPGPIPGINLKRKNPLDTEEIEIRAFAAKMLPPGESAHGFVYFQTRHKSGSHLYVTGVRNAATGEELFFFEVPLD